MRQSYLCSLTTVHFDRKQHVFRKGITGRTFCGEWVELSCLSKWVLLGFSCSSPISESRHWNEKSFLFD